MVSYQKSPDPIISMFSCYNSKIISCKPNNMLSTAVSRPCWPQLELKFWFNKLKDEETIRQQRLEAEKERLRREQERKKAIEIQRLKEKQAAAEKAKHQLNSWTNHLSQKELMNQLMRQQQSRSNNAKATMQKQKSKSNKAKATK